MFAEGDDEAGVAKGTEFYGSLRLVPGALDDENLAGGNPDSIDPNQTTGRLSPPCVNGRLPRTMATQHLVGIGVSDFVERSLSSHR